MNEEERIRRLAGRARMETPPAVDVTDRVMAILHAEASRQTPVSRPLAWVAAVSFGLAIPAGLLGIWVWNSLTDPLVMAFVESPWGML
jgi:hypothetical protein